MALAIPKDSIVLATGVNGYIASHVADQLLRAGYRVRGTTRAIEKVKDLDILFKQKYGLNRIEYVVVPDMSAPGAFDEAIKGVSGIAHIASDVSFSPDPNKVIAPFLTTLNALLTTAAASPTLKRFVYTSSSIAASVPIPNQVRTLDSNSWNTSDIEEAWAPPPYEAERGWAVYGASKSQAEQAVWKFMEEKKPGFVANSVLPNLCLGKILVKGQSASTCGWLVGLYNGVKGSFETLPPQYFVDVQDTARLHVSALIGEDVRGERLYAFSEPFTVNQLLDIMRKLRPEHNFMENFGDDNERDLSIVKSERSVELLKRDFELDGFLGLEDSIKLTLDDLE